MKKRTKKPTSWISGVRQNLQGNPPEGWIILGDIKGAGVQMLPNDCVFIRNNESGNDHELVGKFKIVFEFFRLESSGNVKISARVAGIEGTPLFHEFHGIARGFGCPKPKGTKKKETQSVAAWPSKDERVKFDSKDCEGMADWVRSFFCKMPPDLALFIAAARNLLASS